VGAIRNEQLRKRGVDAAFVKRFETLEGEVTILKLRLQPLFTVMDQRLAMMFHQPHPESAEFDRLLERYHADHDLLRRSLSIREIDRMKHHTFRWMNQTAKGMPGENPEEHFRAMFLDAQLNGLSNVRRYLEEQAQKADAHPKRRSQGADGRPVGH
jgi:hypothetical protein